MLEKLKKEVVKFRDTFLERIHINPSTKDEIIRQFHYLKRMK